MASAGAAAGGAAGGASAAGGAAGGAGWGSMLSSALGNFAKQEKNTQSIAPPGAQMIGTDSEGNQIFVLPANQPVYLMGIRGGKMPEDR